MKRAKCIYPLLLITVFASLASFSFATLSVEGENIVYRGANKGDILFSVDYYVSMIYFDNGFLMLNNFNGLLSSVGFSCDTEVASMTITKVSTREIKYLVDAPTDTNSKTKIYVGSKGRPSDVRGCASWSYNGNLKIVTVNVLYRSPANIIVKWDPVHDWVKSSYSANMDMLWLVVSLVAMGLILSAVRGVPIDLVLLTEFVIGTIILYLGGIILVRFIFQMM